MTAPVVLITGCSSGIGKSLCWAFHRQGYRVVATARRLEAIEDLKTAGMSAIALDITDSTAIQQAISTVLATHHQLDILINNAGYGQFGPLMDISADKLQAQFQTNVFAPLALIQQVAPVMKGQQAGLIVNIGSISGLVTTPFAGAYCASKSALHSLSEALRMELSPFGINVVTVQPGAVQSNIGISADKALAGVLSPDSWYSPFEQTIRDRTNLSQVEAMPAEQFATQLVKQLIRSQPSAIIRLGKKSIWLPLLKKWLPTGLMEFLLKRRFNLQ
ncbi:MAG: SDR family oxidoreductase [Cyanobacteria bacterium J06634_6]